MIKLNRKLLNELNSYGYDIKISLNNRKNFYKITDKNSINPFTRKNDFYLFDIYEDINQFLIDHINYNRTGETSQFNKYCFCFGCKDLFKRR